MSVSAAVSLAVSRTGAASVRFDRRAREMKYTLVCETCAKRTEIGSDLRIGLRVTILCPGCGHLIVGDVTRHRQRDSAIVFADVMEGKL